MAWTFAQWPKLHPRVLVVAGSPCPLSALLVTVVASAKGCIVDLVLESADGEPKGSSTLAAASDGKQVEDAKAFLQDEAGLDLPKEEKEIVDSIHPLLQQDITMESPQDIRVIRGAIVSQMLRAPDGRVVGVHAEIHDPELKETAESNLFSDVVVVCSDGQSQSTKRLMETWQKLEPGNPKGFVHAVAGTSWVQQAHAAYLALKEILETDTPLNTMYGEGPQAMPLHVDYIDHKGTLHEVALRPDRWTPLELKEKKPVTSTLVYFRFALPTPSSQVGIYCGQVLETRVTAVDNTSDQKQEKELIRQYSPVSRNSDYGHVDITVKIGPGQPPLLSMRRVFADMVVGDKLDFRGPAGGFVYRRNSYKAVGMISGGSGITPMMQIMRSVANHPEDRTPVSLLYGTQTEDDIVCKDEMMQYAKNHTNLHVHVTLEKPPADWSMTQGFITTDIMRQHLPRPEAGVVVLLCGPPKMVEIMTKNLLSLGYSDSMIFDFLSSPPNKFGTQKRYHPLKRLETMRFDPAKNDRPCGCGCVLQ